MRAGLINRCVDSQHINRQLSGILQVKTPNICWIQVLRHEAVMLFFTVCVKVNIFGVGTEGKIKQDI